MVIIIAVLSLYSLYSMAQCVYYANFVLLSRLWRPHSETTTMGRCNNLAIRLSHVSTP